MATISWDGPTEGTAAYPIINRAFIRAMMERGHKIAVNQHYLDGALTDVLISCRYPPAPVALLHKVNICISTWEFHGPHNTPASFMEAFATYDRVWAMCQQAADAFAESGVGNVVDGSLGVAPEYNPDGGRDPILLDKPILFPPDTKRLMWVGGTDARHGIDVALEVMRRLPDNYRLIMKLGSYYPFSGLDHPRIAVVRDDLPVRSMATLYRYCAAYLLTARAVAPSLPVMEALACGLPVAAPDLPAMSEFAEWVGPHIHTAPVTSAPMRHHIHKDCSPHWHEVDVVKLAEAAVQAVETPMPKEEARLFGAIYSWDQAAAELEETISECLNSK